jgi:nitrogen fixation protein FixH
MISQDNKEAMRNPWVLGWLGLLITVVAVNVVFIVTAFKTNPGLVDRDYYEKGRYHDNNYQKKLEARNRLGWKIELTTPGSIVINQPGNFSVNISDRIGNPLKDAKVLLHAYRPSDSSADMKIELTPLTTGVFQEKIQLPLKGAWDLNVTVTQGEETLEISRRINVDAG